MENLTGYASAALAVVCGWWLGDGIKRFLASYVFRLDWRPR